MRLIRFRRKRENFSFWREFKIIPRWLVWTVFALYLVAQVAAVLGKYEVSISAILQHESAENNHVPIVITTHLAKEGALQKAIAEINSLPVIQPPAACLRIIDQPRESSAIR